MGIAGHGSFLISLDCGEDRVYESVAMEVSKEQRLYPLHGSNGHPSLAGPQSVADAFGHAMQAAINRFASEIRERVLIAAWLEHRAFW
jgi:hypothetical protein